MKHTHLAKKSGKQKKIDSYFTQKNTQTQVTYLRNKHQIQFYKMTEDRKMSEEQQIDDLQNQQPQLHVQLQQVQNPQVGSNQDDAIIVDESDNEHPKVIALQLSNTMELEDIPLDQQTDFQQQQQQNIESEQMGSSNLRPQGQDSIIQQQMSEQKSYKERQYYDIEIDYQDKPQSLQPQQNIQMRIDQQQQQKQKSRSKSPQMRILHNYRFLAENHSHYEVKKNIEDHIDQWRTYQRKSEWNPFYRDLEYDHAFIQWVSPNFFKSMFNSSSYALTFEEREKMIEDDEIMRKYLENIYMYIRFLGIEHFIEKENHIWELTDQRQFRECLFIHTHNQMRIQRVLASLSVLGQRSIALSFLEALRKLIRMCAQDQYDYGLYDRLFSNYEILEEEITDKQGVQQVQPKQFQNYSIKDKSPKLKVFENYKNYYFPREMLNSKEVCIEILKDRRSLISDKRP